MRLIRYSYPTLHRSPWTGLEHEIDRLFEGALAAEERPLLLVDLFEDAGNAYVRAELPGVARDAINVEVADGTLTITAPGLARSVSVPDAAADKVSAAYENGVLTVTLPKREEARPRKIDVAVK